MEYESIFEINYTYPKDIEDHNAKEVAHDYLLALDGSRTDTGILQYDNNKTFTNLLDIVNKYYIDNKVDTNITLAQEITKTYVTLATD